MARNPCYWNSSYRYGLITSLNINGEEPMKTLPSLSVLLPLLVCSIPLTAADRPWIEVKTDHFTVLSNSGEKDAREAAVDLERIRLVLTKLLPSLKTDPNAPILVFITADEDLYGSLVPEYKKRS